MRWRAAAAAVGELDGGERHAEAEDVGEHVAGVGEQGERAGEQAGDDLDDHEDGEQPRRRWRGGAGGGRPARIVRWPWSWSRAHAGNGRPSPGRNRPARASVPGVAVAVGAYAR